MADETSDQQGTFVDSYEDVSTFALNNTGDARSTRRNRMHLHVEHQGR